jgi:hypothetical protein
MGNNGSVIIDPVPEVDTTVFTYTGGPQTFYVPPNISKLKVTAIGASGGYGGATHANGQPLFKGGIGGVLTNVLNVTPNSLLNIVVGGYPAGSPIPAYGFGGNGAATTWANRTGAAGGGLSGVFNGTITQANAIFVAAGGGGASSGVGQSNGNGGAGGRSPNGNGQNGGEDSSAFGQNAGSGASQSSNTPGGAGTVYDAQTVPPTAGIALQGGQGGLATNTVFNGGGAGGAGYWGGGGGAGGGDASGGGGGGSSRLVPIDRNDSGYKANVMYSYTGKLETYVVPDGVTQLRVTAVGASGGYTSGAIGGSGSNITSLINVTPNTTLYVYVGGCPGNSNVATRLTGVTTTVGAGNGGSYYNFYLGNSTMRTSAAGGDMSGVFTSNAVTHANTLVVAGGGGGATFPDGNYFGGNGGSGPSGNASNGKSGIGFAFGRGGTSTGPGIAGTVDITYPNNPNPQAGSALKGGDGGYRSLIETAPVPFTEYGGGGGGAGYWGGGGGAAGGNVNRQGGGGGGSSWAANTMTFNTQNGNGFHGKVYIEPSIITQGNGIVIIQTLA